MAVCFAAGEHVPFFRGSTYCGKLQQWTYTIDTCPGHSGSPLWLLGNDEIRLLLGIRTVEVASAKLDGKSANVL